MSQTIALVVAAGRGSRFGQAAPKQYTPLGGMALLRHSLLRLTAHPEIDAVRVVIHPDDEGAYAEATRSLELLPPVAGGETRQASVRLGLESLGPLEPERVLIHDAARPFPPQEMVDRLLQALNEHAGAVPALPLVDTLKREIPKSLAVTGPAREGLWRVQTPQAFRFQAILAAHRAAAGGEETDDAAVAEKAGIAVALTPGSEENFKVTTREDLTRAEALLSSRLETRVGSGFDVHRFGEGTAVTLCGVTIPHAQGLKGHSDADVGLHALTDAILGGLVEGDIGQHFPPSDDRWRGAASSTFLAHARMLVEARGGLIRHVDVTLICESPKIGPYRGAMRDHVARVLDIEAARVSIKATTTEGLGFTGRREGIAAQALATLALPR